MIERGKLHTVSGFPLIEAIEQAVRIIFGCMPQNINHGAAPAPEGPHVLGLR